MARRISYVTWNLVATGFLALVALEEVVSTMTGHSGSPVLWFLSAATVAALAWGVWQRRRRPSWLLPRLYLAVAVPLQLSLLVVSDMTAFWLGAIWLLIVPATLSGSWIDRWWGFPAGTRA